MIFRISCIKGIWPDEQVDTGKSLCAYFPIGRKCSQLNYGQGEGQALIDGSEWGFYFDSEGQMEMVLHSGSLSRDEAAEIVSAVCERLNSYQTGEFVFDSVEP